MNNIVRNRIASSLFLPLNTCCCCVYYFSVHHLSQLLIGLCVFVAVYCHQYQQCSEYIVVTNSIVVVVVVVVVDVVDEPFILLFCVYVNALKRTIHLPVFFSSFISFCFFFNRDVSLAHTYVYIHAGP